MFVDASALVAMIVGEPEQARFVDAMVEDGDPIWSPMSCWETVASLRSSYKFSVENARVRVEEAADQMALTLKPIGNEELRRALDAYLAYGKGRHPAKLNMGDCFAYACAKTNNARLLYKGNDFIHTDLA